MSPLLCKASPGKLLLTQMYHKPGLNSNLILSSVFLEHLAGLSAESIFSNLFLWVAFFKLPLQTTFSQLVIRLFYYARLRILILDVL